MKAETQDLIGENLEDLECIPTILEQMIESFSLDKSELNKMEEYKLVNFYSQITNVIRLSEKIITKSVENIKTVILEKDSNEPDATAETAKNQK